MKLISILDAYVEPIHGGPGDAAPLPVEQLQEQLEALRRENNNYFALLVAMVLMGYLVVLWLVISRLGEATQAGYALGGLGIPGSAAIYKMARLWREKVAIDILLALSVAMDADTLKSIIRVLSESLRR